MPVTQNLLLVLKYEQLDNSVHIVVNRLLVKSFQNISKDLDVRYIFHKTCYASVFFIFIPYHRIYVDVIRFMNLFQLLLNTKLGGKR